MPDGQLLAALLENVLEKKQVVQHEHTGEVMKISILMTDIIFLYMVDTIGFLSCISNLISMNYFIPFDTEIEIGSALSNRGCLLEIKVSYYFATHACICCCISLIICLPTHKSF